MTIHEASRLTGVSCDMIRHYEKLGLLKPRRNQNRYRDFSTEDLNRIVLIKGYSNLGIELKYLKTAIDSDGVALLAQKLRSRLEELQLYLRTLEAEIAMGRSLLRSYVDMGNGYSIAPVTVRFLYPRDEKEPEFYRRCLEISEAGGVYHYYYRLTLDQPTLDQPLGQPSVQPASPSGKPSNSRRPRAQSGLLLYSPLPLGPEEGEFMSAHLVYRVSMLRDHTQYITMDDLAEHFERISSLGYTAVPDVLMYQTAEFQQENRRLYLVCVEIPLKQTD